MRENPANIHKAQMCRSHRNLTQCVHQRAGAQLCEYQPGRSRSACEPSTCEAKDKHRATLGASDERTLNACMVCTEVEKGLSRICFKVQDETMSFTPVPSKLLRMCMRTHQQRWCVCAFVCGSSCQCAYLCVCVRERRRGREREGACCVQYNQHSHFGLIGIIDWN